MGTDWYPHCVDCNDTYPSEAIDLYGAMDLCGDAPHFATIATAHVNIEVIYLGSRVNCEWFAKHAGHRLKPIDEFGRLDGNCNKPIACPTCGITRRYCKQPEGHEGGCA